MIPRNPTHPVSLLALVAAVNSVPQVAVAQPNPPTNSGRAAASSNTPGPSQTPARKEPTASAEPNAPSTDSTPPDGEVTPPALLEFVEAEHRPQADALTEPMAILLALTVLPDGTVSDVEVLQSADANLGAAAAKAVAQFRFSPAKRGGEAIAVRIQYSYVFEPPLPEPEAAPAPAPAVEASATDPGTPTGTLRGRIQARGTRKALIGTVVKLPQLQRETLTDENGGFEFEAVPAGMVRIVVEDSEHQRVSDEESIEADQLTEVTYYLEQTSFGEDDLVVEGKAPHKEVTRHALSAREVTTVPGSNGDMLKSVQNLPGVARTTDDRIVLRGGGDTQVYVNGLPLPAAFHFFGLRSTVGSGLLDSVDIMPGNYDARYGRGNGGVIDIKLRRPADDGLHGFGQVDLFDASAFVEGPINDKSSFAIGLRRSYFDSILPLVLDEDGKRMFQTAPRYYDGQAAYDYKTSKHHVRATVLASSDSMELLFDEPVASDPALRGDLSYKMAWVTEQLTWDYFASASTKHSVGVSHLVGFNEQHVGRDTKLEFSTHLFALRDEITHQANDWLALRGGLDAQVDYYDFDVAIPPPPKEGEIPQPLATQDNLVARGNATNVKPALWAAADIQLGSVLLVPSLRVDHYSFVDEFDGVSVVQPRLNTRWAVTDRTALKAGVGYFSEAPDLDESNDVFGNPASKPDQSVHYSAGVEQKLSEALSLDVTGFYKHLYDMLVPVDDPNVRYDNTGKGRAYGGEVLLRHQSQSRFYGWLAYTLMRSERRDAGETDYRLFDTDQTHNLTAVGQYRLSPTWEIGARFRYVSGNPTTPVADATYDSDADVYVPIYGAHNSDRLDAFHQLDIRVDKHFIFDTWKLTTYLDVQNAYNRMNPEGTNYNYDYSQSKTAGGLPLLPSFGVKGEF